MSIIELLRAVNSINPDKTLFQIPVTLNMIVPTGQCGSIIGKGGFRIKEIRENTGCNVKIANDLLPGSTEKLITLYGEPRVIEECVKAICQVRLTILLQ